MNTLDAGELRHYIRIDSRTNTRDSNTGESVTTWTKLADVWAKISPLSGKEFIAAQSVSSEVTGRVTIRYRDDVSATNRIVYRNKVYNIVAVLPDNESGLEWLTLLTSEGVTDGR